MTRRWPETFLLFALAWQSIAAAGAAAPAIPAEAYSALRWRSVGPLRAGWSTCAAGIPGRPDTYYFGTADGGVWKTTDSGRTWTPLMEHEAAASVGALAIAPSDPDVIYVGTGQVAPRWDIAYGNGMFRSTDGGRTWRAAGLADSRHIGRILVDPRDANVVLVAALGNLFGPGEERGVFRSTDGGATWSRVLYENDTTGAVDLAVGSDAPEIVYAALWQAQRHPWQAYFTPVVGPASGIRKSTDGGRTWTALGGGLPPGPLGRIGLAVAPGSNGRRVYAVIDAGQDTGLYRSDDAGTSWTRVNADKSLGDWYFGRLTVDPLDPDVVYVMGRSLRRSDDGGATFTTVKGSPGGDDYHDLWIDPRDPRRRVLASDQGTAVTVNGGTSWSTWYNQPTGQFYHVATDDRFPYWIYSGQQDSGTVAVASRSDYGRLTFRDWHPVGADERDYDIPSPADPEIIYGSGLGGRLSRWDARTGQVQNVSPWPVTTYAARPTTVRYRYTWLTPLAISPVPPHAIYQGAQVLFRSTDGGRSWEVISPDLTGAVADAGDCEGDVSVERARACGYGVISTIAPSPLAADQVWVGTDDGLVHLTRDGGKTWRDVTPVGVRDWSRVASIDASPTDAATAYAAVDRHRSDDLRPYAFRTHDYGANWTAVSGGLPDGAHLNVVRQDPARAGLLYAGTSRGAWVSFDDGERWQSLQLNLPTTGVTDLTVHDNDLVAATLGRALWVLDDVTPLRHLSAEALASGMWLAPSAPAMRLRHNQARDTPLPPDEPALSNPPTGAVIDYVLASEPASPLVLEILDHRGKIVRRFASDETPPAPNAEPYFTAEWLRPAQPLPAGAGHHRFVWDLRYARPKAIRYDYSIAATPGEDTPVLPRGAFVLPGRYEVRLSAGGRTVSRELEVELDPRVQTSRADLEAQLALERQVADALAAATDTYHEVGSLADALQGLEGRLENRRGAGKTLAVVRALASELERFTTGRTEDNVAKTGAVLGALATDLESVDRAPTDPQREVFETYSGRLRTALEHWNTLRSGPRRRELDRRLRKLGEPPLEP